MSKAKPKGYWTLERCIDSAAKHLSIADWRGESSSAYQAAARNGWIDECCAHMSGRRKSAGYWTIAKCKDDAAKYAGRRQWQVSSRAAYDAALREGWLEECCAHMSPAPKSTDNDVVYIWRDDVTGLHKVGITSDRLGEYRIGGDNKGMDPRIVLMLKVDDARAVESKLLELGADPELDSSIDGYTEFRRLTDAELGEAVSIAYEAALAA